MIIKIIKVVAIVLATLLLISFILPREIVIARSIVINAGPERIFPLIDSPKAEARWSPWAKRDPKIVNKFTGPESGVGAANSWNSDHPKVGTGSQKIIKSIKNKLSVSALDFGGHGTAESSFVLMPVGKATKVTWDMKTDAGYNPIMRWVGFLFFDGWIGKDYEQGLQSLKELVEGKIAKP